MNSRLIAALAVATVATGASARHLSPVEALARLNENGKTPAKARSIAQKAAVPALEVKVADAAADALPMAYVFGNKETKGYVVVSADDVAKPLLGYSENGVFDPDNMPVNMKTWLEEYAAQIAVAASNPQPKGFGFLRSNAADYAVIEPMVTTRWNQSAPYNDVCPEVYGRRSVTGCLATAEAQVMNYHKWPEKLTGTASYKWTVGGTTLTVDMDTVPLVWSKMKDDYTTEVPGTAEERRAVADLMYACGIASQMNYSPSQSGATSVNGAQGFYNYFGCTEAGVLLCDWLNPDQRNEYVYNYLVEHGPLVYCGQSSSGGHAFVCDGYRGDGFFHFNWGWGGMSDGYFQLSALNPGSQGIGGTSSGYNSSQQLIPGLYKPGDIKNFKPVFAADGGIKISSDNNGLLGDTVLIEGAGETDGFWNFSMATVKVTYGVKILRNATNEVRYVDCAGIRDRELPSMRGWRSYYFDVPKDLEEGTYTVTPAANAYGNGWQEMYVEQSCDTYVLMTVKGDSVLFDRPQPAPVLIDEIEFGTPVVAGGGFTLKARATATSDRNFYGNVTLVLGELYEGEMLADFQAAPVLISAKPGVYNEFSFDGTFTNQRLKGEYTLVFINSDNGEIVSEPITVTVKPYPGKAEITVTNASIPNAAAVNPNDVRVNMDLNCVKGYFSGVLLLTVGNYDDKGNFNQVTEFSSPTNYVMAGETATLNFGGGVAADAGSVFDALVRYYDASTRKYQVLAGPLTFTIGTAAVEDVTADASQAVVCSYNAAAGTLAVTSSESEIALVEVYSAAGQLVESVPVAAMTVSADVAALPCGVYVAKVTLANGTTATARFVK